jgi:hypothetical protein
VGLPLALAAATAAAAAAAAAEVAAAAAAGRLCTGRCKGKAELANDAAPSPAPCCRPLPSPRPPLRPFLSLCTSEFPHPSGPAFLSLFSEALTQDRRVSAMDSGSTAAGSSRSRLFTSLQPLSLLQCGLTAALQCVEAARMDDGQD